MMHYFLLLSKQGKVRLSKWFVPLSIKDKAKVTKDVTDLVLERKGKMSNFFEYKDNIVVYRRYASLYFVAAIDPTDNELGTLELIHFYVESLDRYFGNVCELDLIFNFQKAYHMLDELLLGGEIQETSKKNLIRAMHQQDVLADHPEQAQQSLGK